ncbi:hypothetical protein [Rhizobium sp. L1K21]|uniref:hypothetical protein n=1 Tax=Rhizobium sp. L1K21 TaxID=2954933 RepID=UPI00209272AA|nr:hypothetical protein [Rhizobium sp. L1K21]MCO6188347.1 hypothetical protein [Rhizobium sp. L1K21]
MEFTRRELVGGALASLALPTIGYANSDLEFTQAIILENLEKSIWLSTNTAAKRAVYVMAAPWCPFCHQLYEAQAAIEHDLDFRFVYMSFRRFGNAVANAYFSDRQDQVGLFYENPNEKNNALSDKSAAFIDEVNTVAGHIMAPAVGSHISGSGGSSSGQSFAYPTVVFMDSQSRLQAMLGAWNSLDYLISESGTATSPEADPGRYSDLVRSPPVRRGVNRNHFAKVKGTYLYSAPRLDAPKVDVLEEGSGYFFEYSAEVDGEQWIGTAPFNNYAGLSWGKKADFFTQ